LRAIRTHGVENVIDPGAWGSELGFNFRITDVQSSLGLVQLSKVKRRLEKVNRIHSLYKEGMSSCSGISIIPVATQAGEIPIYNEVLCADRDGLIKHFSSYNIETRPFLPNLASAEYFYSDESGLTCSQRFAQQGCTLPSGPGQKMQDIDYVVQTARKFSG
jgi:perosamine synthetase